MAGAEEQHPGMTTKELVELIKHTNRHPVERDTLYNIVTDFKDVVFEEEKPSYYALPVVQ
jgi:aminodeoxyfutalosine synthase